MDNQTLSMDIFVKSLTKDQADSCESDEQQLGEVFKAGWSEAAAVQFHRTMLHARRVIPEATVEGVFEVAFKLGLEDVLARLTGRRCAVPPDVQLRRGKSNRGVRVVGVPGNKHGRAGVSIREA